MIFLYFPADVQDMLREFENLLSDKLQISADKDTLKEQVADFEPLYQEIMGKEHEIVMLISRGRDVISKAKKADAKTQQKTLDEIEKQWQKVKNILSKLVKILFEIVKFCHNLSNCAKNCQNISTIVKCLSILPNLLIQAEACPDLFKLVKSCINL